MLFETILLADGLKKESLESASTEKWRGYNWMIVIHKPWQRGWTREALFWELFECFETQYVAGKSSIH